MATIDSHTRAVLNSLPTHLAIIDGAGIVVQVNDAWAEFARQNGASEAIVAANGSTYKDLCRKSGRYQDEDAVRAIKAIGSVLQGQAIDHRMEYPCVTADKTRWFVMIVMPLQDEQGGVVVSHYDITDRKYSERRRAWFDQIFDRSLNEIFVFDADTFGFVEVNHAARTNLGYSIDEMRRLTPVDIKPQYELEDFRKLVGSLVSGKQSKIEFHTIHQRKDGSRYPVEIHLQMMQFDERPLFVAIVLDITERTVSAEALAQAQLFLESAPDAMLIVGAEGAIEIANSQAEKLFGYPRATLQNMNVDALVPVRFRDAHADNRGRYFKAPRVRGMGSELDLFGVTKDGEEIPIEVSLSPIKTLDGMRVAAAIRNVTQRREDARILQAAKEAAENATVTKTRFLAAASHDLRQPLQSIGLYLSTLTRLLDQPKPLEISTKIRDSLTVMNDILEALLDVSKFESGSVTPVRKEFPIQILFDKLRTDAEPHGMEKGLTLEIEDSDCMVDSDPALLLRIVENFMTNAIRYTNSGYVKVRCVCAGSSARIEVEDSGIGIPAEVLETIFEEYFQVENNVRDRNQGLGLGLSIVKYIAALLNHPLNIKSVPGEGSTFSVDVPKAETQSDAIISQTAVEVSPVRNNQPSVLFVDDDPAIVDGIKELFELINMELCCAGSGDEALQHIRNGVKPDVLISDFRLPDYNGIEVVQRVRQCTRGDLPAVILTGDTSSAEIDRANLSNCRVLHKPVDIDELVTYVEQVTR